MQNLTNTFKINSYGKTDIGLKRKTNEDAFMLKKFTFLVTDGMGGEAGGDIASQIFKTTTENILSKINKQPQDDIKQTLKDIFSQSNKKNS